MDQDPLRQRIVHLEERLRIATAALVKIVSCTGRGTLENREALAALADVGYDVNKIERDW